MQLNKIQLFLVLTLFLISQMTSGQSEDKIVELAPYTVKSQKIQRSLFETQESIAVVSSNTIADRTLRDLEDVYLQTANVYSLTGEGFGIRGITHNSIATGGGEGELASYYIDGVAFTGFSKRFGPSNLWDVEQVEILRGPQSTNVGRNALAGAVSVRTKNPVINRESALRAGVGEYNSYEIAGMFNTNLGETTAIRITAEHNYTDGFVSNPTLATDDYDSRENTTIRGKWLWESQGANDFRVLLTAQYGSTHRGENLVSLENPDKRENFSNLIAFENNESWTATAEVTGSLSDAWDFLALTSIISADYDRFDDDDQGPGGADAFRGRQATDENWSQEIRLNYDNGERLRGVLGVFYTKVDLENNTDGKINIDPVLVGVPEILLPFYPALLSVGIEGFTMVETDNAAFFTEWEYDLDSRWTVFAGFRYDSEERSRESSSGNFLVTELPDPSTPGFPPPVSFGLTQVNARLLSQISSSSSADSTSYEALLPQIGIKYEISENVNTSFHIKQGYRAGGAETNILGVVSEYDPEFLTNYEWSIRANLYDDKLFASANVYFGSWTDQQVSVQQSENSFDVLTENAGESEIYGTEIELIGRATEDLVLFASYGFAHTEFVKFESGRGDFTGNQFAIAPEQTLAFGGSFSITENITFHANVTHQGEAFADVGNTLDLDAHTLANLRLSYDAENWSAKIYVSNLFDELYLQSNVTSLSGQPIGVVGDPRFIGFELNAQF